ncbi:YwmB family TATA-box binding protein [Sulfobacillus harzensis]|uniref:TATA-box binding protein n=1 Tax=Sulfobacillus harzensis TaxID=2729629 RepID=A0A7Y0Q1M9_9FIRM|nr:YwmB family TATA-box binding protein [Sulfobacillus harzensis]NMP21001.1 hypothetical protein [Sulfobacillus harzensis]
MRNIWWVVGIGALIWVGAEAHAAVVKPLTTAFHATGAKPSGYSLNDWTRVAPQKAQNLSALADQVAGELHMQGPQAFVNNPSYQKISETKKVAGIVTQIIVERLSSGDTYVVLDRTSPDGFQGLPESQTLFRHILAGYGRVHQDVNLEGVLPNRLNTAQQQRLVNQALSAVDAKTLNGITTAGYISDAGHSPFISQSDALDGHQVNVQVAVSYNGYMHQTQVYVGSPLITVTY